MKCYEDVVYSEFLDNELNPEERKKVSAHLKECQKCQKVIMRLKKENFKIKELFERDISSPDLVPVVMNQIAKPALYSKKKKFWASVVYGIFVLTGILAPYFLSLYLKSIDLFQNIISFVFTPLKLISSLLFFLLREAILITPRELTGMIIVQIIILALFIMSLSHYLFKNKKILKEEYK